MKTSQECETALTSQYQIIFLVFLSFYFFVFLPFCPFVLFSFCPLALLSFFLFVFLSFCTFRNFCILYFCLFVFSSWHHTDQMSEGSQVSKVTICVKILKWQWLTAVHWLTDWPRSGIELPGQLKTDSMGYHPPQQTYLIGVKVGSTFIAFPLYDIAFQSVRNFASLCDYHAFQTVQQY